MEATTKNQLGYPWLRLGKARKGYPPAERCHLGVAEVRPGVGVVDAPREMGLVLPVGRGEARGSRLSRSSTEIISRPGGGGWTQASMHPGTRTPASE